MVEQEQGKVNTYLKKLKSFYLFQLLMKKFILLCLCILTGCVAPVPNDNYEVKRCTGIQELAYEEVAYNIENNVDFILYIGRSDCKDCIEFHPLLENYLEENCLMMLFLIYQKI